MLQALHRQQHRLAALCYRYQDERLRFVRLLANTPLPHRDPRLLNGKAFPLYGFVRTHGVLRMVRLPGIRGAAQVEGPLCRFSTKELRNAVVLSVEGEIDLANRAMLSTFIADAYRTNSTVIVDVSRLDYLDVSGIHVLLRAAQSHRFHFAVAGPQPAVRRVFELLNLLETLPVVKSAEEAEEYLRLQ